MELVLVALADTPVGGPEGAVVHINSLILMTILVTSIYCRP